MDEAHHIHKNFDIGDTDMLRIEKYGCGHINDTFLGTSLNGSEMPKKFVFQRVNHHVFPEVPEVMENILRVTSHIHDKLVASGCPDPERRTLSVIRANDGNPFYQDPDGDYWRAYPFIDNTRWVDVVTSAEEALAAAIAFGNFAKGVSDIPDPPLHVTIPRFHDTPNRFNNLKKAIEADSKNRAASVREEIDFAMSCEQWHDVVAKAQESGEVPQRIAHNDTKINNVLFDGTSGEGICVIDLDTVMPGSALHDFGDLVRTAAATAAEDELDLDRVGITLPIFEALAKGYLESCGDVLTPKEVELLAMSGKLMTFEVGMRFLTDHLQGDTYFKIHRPGHNLDRARTQFQLVRKLQEAEEQMSSVVEQLAG